MGIKDPMVVIFLDCLIGHQHCFVLNSHGKLVASTMKCNVPAEHGGEFCKMASFSLDYSPHFISKYWALLRASGSRGSPRLLDGNMVIYSHPKPRRRQILQSKMMWNRTAAERGQVFPSIFCCAACQSLKPGTAGLWFTSKSCSHMPRVAAMSTFHILTLAGFCCCQWEITGDDTGSMKMLAVSFVGQSELWRPFNVYEKLKHNSTVVVIFIQGCCVHVKKQEFQPAREHVLKGQGPKRWRSLWHTHSSKPTSHANMAPVTSASAVPMKWWGGYQKMKTPPCPVKKESTKQHQKSYPNIPKSQSFNHPSIFQSIHSSIDSCMVDVPVGPHVRQGTRSSDLNQRNRCFTNKSLEVFFPEGIPEFHLDCLFYYWSRRRGWNMGEIMKTLSENGASHWDFLTFIRTQSATASLFHFKTSSNLATTFLHVFTV